jgi:hypothetical protein
MKLLIDNDAFCKLGSGGLLLESLALLGVDLGSCGRLPSLPHMLRRGALPRRYGQPACDRLIGMAEAIPLLPAIEVSWLDLLTGVPDIDVGEVQLFAAAAQHKLLVMTGDKRALRALKNIPAYVPALANRIIVLEPMLHALCLHLGDEVVRKHLGPAIGTDKTLMICFSSTNQSPRTGLTSYFKSLATDVHPLLLWDSKTG